MPVRKNYISGMATMDEANDTPRKRAKPEKIGGYIPEKQIGKGAMGDIWLCEDPSLCRHVVVKQMQASLRGYEDLMKRFQRESVLLAALHHPNIAHPYALWQERNGRLALAMEFVEGKTFREILDADKQPPLWVVLYLLHEILQALECVHRHNIIHRDLKPSNMMVEKNGRVRLLDFGIARDANPGQDMTMPGSVLGTAAYMSPEQVVGKPVTFRSDLFSLGIIACEMVIGRNPFRGENIEITSQCILNMKIKSSHFPVSTPSALRKWILRALEKKPERRFNSTEEAADALAKVMTGLPRELDRPLSGWLKATFTGVPFTDSPVWETKKMFRAGAITGAVCMFIVGAGLMYLLGPRIWG